jgi:hypothetical protein
MTAKAYSSYSSSDVTSVIGPRSTVKLDTCYDVSIRGCNKRCPCRGWINCPAYVDITEQQKRLKNKSDENYNDIHKWYETNFRIQYEHGEILGNG